MVCYRNGKDQVFFVVLSFFFKKVFLNLYLIRTLALDCYKAKKEIKENLISNK